MTNPNHGRHRFWRVFYDRLAFAYDAVLNTGAWLRVGSEQRVREEVIASLQFAEGGRVLEIGCGTAANRQYMRGHSSYVGLDISRGMLVRAKRKCAELGLGADFVQADAAALPLASNVAAFVLAMGVLQHTVDPGSAIREMQRVGKAKGRMLIIDERRSQARLLNALRWKKVPLLIGDYFAIHLPME
jgi:ubiquinone/menaquinone biosynthesis C-methylase UbiE